MCGAGAAGGGRSASIAQVVAAKSARMEREAQAQAQGAHLSIGQAPARPFPPARTYALARPGNTTHITTLRCTTS